MTDGNSDGFPNIIRNAILVGKMFEKGNLSTFEKGLFPIIGKYSLENSIVGKVVSFSLISVSFYGFSNLYSWIGGYCINIIYLLAELI